MKKLILISGIILFTFSLIAQVQRRQGNFEELRTKKIAFITDKLELSPEEAQNFWPYYNEFDKMKIELHTQKRSLEKEIWQNLDSYTDDDFKRIYKQLTEIHEKEYQLVKKYRKKFFEVLPAKKAISLEYIEHQFRSHMFREYRNRRHAQE